MSLLPLVMLPQAVWNDNVAIEVQQLPPAAEAALASYEHCVADHVIAWSAKQPFRQTQPGEIILPCADLRKSVREQATRVALAAPNSHPREDQQTVDVILNLTDRKAGVLVTNYTPADGRIRW